MKIKFEITPAEKRVFFQIIAILLCIFVVLISVMGCVTIKELYNLSENAYVVLCVVCGGIDTIIILVILNVFGNK